jgi:hypothetical protein
MLPTLTPSTDKIGQRRADTAIGPPPRFRFPPAATKIWAEIWSWQGGSR